MGARRSIRQYSKAPLPMGFLSQLLWSAQGITGSDHERTVPSAGGLYPLHLRISVQRVSEVDPGIYEYMTESHSLKLVGDRVPEGTLYELGIGDQPWLIGVAMPSQGGFSGITLAHNVASKSEVDAVLNQAVSAGAKLIKPAEEVFWGGYSGYFQDPEGHYWEVAYNPYQDLT
nr:VOC family protein [Halomonas gudaonensis]